MRPLRLGQVGCGRMGLRHLYGQIELRRQGFDTFDLVALCDLHESAAGHVAGEAEEAFGTRPRTYTSFETMLERERLDAIDIVTDTQTHHTYALEAFDAGTHVAIEKPMALTVRACRKVVDGARKAGRTLSISENYRRDPMNRLTHALIQGGAIGEPRMMINMAVGGGGDRRVVTAWRSLKLRSGGPVLEQGVHTSDLILYFMGDVQRVSAETHLWDKRLYATQEPGLMSGTYAHRVPEDMDVQESFEPTAEDTAFAVLRFTSGAMGQLAMTSAAGDGSRTNVIYGSEGAITMPPSRTGAPVQVGPSGSNKALVGEDALVLAPDFELDELTCRFFGGKRRLPSYHMTSEEIDRKLIAIELQDFADAISDSREPEVTGEAGLRAVALSYAILESGHMGRTVAFGDVAEDRISSYQDEINAAMGL